MQALFAIFSSTDHLIIISANMAKGSGTQSHQIFVMEVQTATNFLHYSRFVPSSSTRSQSALVMFLSDHLELVQNRTLSFFILSLFVLRWRLMLVYVLSDDRDAFYCVQRFARFSYC